MRTIRLIAGAGNGKDRACLATAVAMIAGAGEQTDHPGCLCPVITWFVRQTNDSIGNHSLDLLAETYGDLPWQIIGTITDDNSIMQQRAFVAADYTVRRFAPITLRSAGLNTEAETLESLPQITNATSARAAAYAERASANAERAAAYAAYAANAERAAARAADAAVRAAHAAHAWPAIARLCRQCILDMAAIGSRIPIEPCMTQDELAEVLTTQE